MQRAQQNFRALLLTALTVLLLLTGCFEKMNPGPEAENDMYDGPDKAALQEFQMTKDPATGQVPKERLIAALDQTLQNRQTYRPGDPTLSLPLLSWIERGPNSDVVGPSNGNTRANGGITAGRVRAIMIDSADATHKTVWVGGVDGGLWKTTDITTSPANWILVNDFLSNLAIAAICQDPTDFNTMYMCTGESYFNGDAVQGVGVFKSTDHGVTWNFLPSTAAYKNGTRILCDFQGNIYLATRGNGVLRSTKASGGAAWTVITPNTAPNQDICDMEISSTSAPGRLHIVTGIFSTQAYRYTDIPATCTPAAGWNSPVTAFPSFAMRAEIAVNGNTLYAAPANGSYQVPTMYKSTDGGANWAATAAQPGGGSWANGQGWYSLSVVINPADPNQCIVGGLDNYKTTNGGASWTQISAWVGFAGQYVHADQHHALWWDGGNKLMFACDGGIHYSGDGGTTIRDRNIGLRIKQFYSVAIHPSTTNYFLAGAQDNGTHQLTLPGLGSSVEVTGGDGAFVAIDQDQPQFQFGAYVYNQYRRSTDGGASWSSINFNTNGNFINQWDYDNLNNKIYASYVGGQYLRWEDPQTGSTTSIINIASFNAAQVSAVTVSPFTANRVYFGTEGGRIVKVDNANTGVPTDINLTQVGMPGGNLSCVATGTDDQNLMVCYSNYGVNNVWVSTNGGTTWTAVDGNLPDMPVRWCMFYPGDNTKAYLATEMGVWETDLLNGGSTLWASDPTFPTVRTDMIKYRPSDRTIAAGTHGRGVWTATVPNGCTPPAVTVQPSNSSICEGANTSFSVTATGTAPLTYQWQVSTDGGFTFSPLANGGVYSNVTTASMNITGATVGMSNYRYRVVVSGPCAPNATSNAAILTVGANASAGVVSGTTPLCIGATATYTSSGTGGGTWSSSAPGVATVNPVTGLVAAVSAGTTTITYTVSGCSGSVSASKVLTVSPNVSAGVVSGTSPLCIGQTSTYTSNGTAGGTWSSSVPGVATVNSSTGLVSAVSAGATTITYTVTGCGGPVSASKLLTVSPNANAGVVSGTTPLCIGQTTTYTSNGDPGGTWSSSAPGIATVNPATGLVTPVSAGTSTITYTVGGCNGPVSASKVLTVSPNANAGTVSGASPICIGQSTTYTSNGDAGGTWSSSAPGVASVNAGSGVVTGVSAGTSTITYTVSGCNGPVSASKVVTVSPNVNAGTVSGTTPLCIGQSTTYTSNGDPGGTWSSSAPGVATVNASTGQVAAVSAGTTTITYTVSGCGGPQSASKVLTVSPNANAGTVSGDSPLCEIGSMTTYTSNGDPGGTWTSSNPAVATVNPATGVVTLVSPGSTTITYTVTGCNGPVSASKVLLVATPGNPGTVSGTSPLCIGQNTTYTSNGDSGGTWSSSTPGVATINSGSGQVTAVSAGTTTITYTVSGCTGFVSASKVLTVNPNANAGSVSGTTPLCIAQTTTFTSNGDPGGIWSSNAPGVATVNSSTGQVTAVSAGTTTITYTVSGCNGPVSATKVLTVSPNANAGSVSGASPICISQSTTYTSNGDAGGTWSSSAPGVATVNAGSGVVTGVSAGTSTITYIVSGCNGPVSASKVVTVSPNVNAGTVSGTTPLCIGQSTTYTSNGDPGGTWSSSAPGVATVNSGSGQVVAVSAGTTTITYTVNGCGGPTSASKVLTVSPNANAGTVSGTTPLCIGATATYTSDGDPGGTWSSSAPGVATINSSTGFVTAVSAGTTTITYTVTGCNGPVSASKLLTVISAANAGTVSGATPMCIGQTANYTSNGDPGGTWSSSAPGVATVNSGSGQVTAVSAGTTTITYTVNGCSGSASASKVLTVNPNANAGSVSGTTPLCIGQTTTYTSNGDPGGTWSSSAPGVATVNSSTGQVTAVAAGTTTITYTVSGCNGPVSASKVLTVSPNANAGTVSGASPICISQSATYTSNGNAGGIWSSSAPGVASVNAGSGVVTGVSAGTSTITYTVSGCNGPVSASKVVTVSPNVNAGTVSGTTPLCIGQTATYTSNGDAGGTWSSSTPGVATVNTSTGQVTAISAGTSTITYTVNGCGGPKSASKVLTVSPNANAGIVSGTTPLCIGATATYTSNGDAGGTWSSSAPGVAAVNSSTGLVTAVSAGTTTITYTVTGCNGPASASKVLTVSPNVTAGTVSGTSPLCIGATATYTSNGTGGGSWSSSAPGIASVNASTGIVTAVSAGTATITYTVSGCGGPLTSSKNVVVNALPQGSLSANGPFVGSGTGMLTWTATAGTDPFTVIYFDGTANRTATGVMSGVAFNVFTNPVTATTTYTLVSVSDGNCTRSSGFTDGSATITVTGSSCTGYTVLGTKDVNLGEGNTVNGDVGNTGGPGKKVEIHRNSTVNGLVRANVINLQMPVTVTGGLFYTAAVVALPPVLSNTVVVPTGNFTVPDNGVATINTNYHDLTIGKNAVVTINGTIYGTLHIKEGATVTFTAGDIYIDDLTADDGKASPLKYTTINFANDANVRIKNTVDFGARNRVNESSSKRVTFYLKDGDTSGAPESYTVNGTDTRITTGIYIPKGKLVINNNGPCSMTGTFISENITSSKNVTWNCGNSIPQADPVMTMLIPEEEFNVKVFPNPSNAEFSIQVSGSSTAPVTIRIIDAAGREMHSIKTTASKPAVLKVGADWNAGTYYAQVTQDNHVQTIKLIKMQ